MIVYLAGPINGCGDDHAVAWRQQFKALRPDLEYLDPMRRDCRGIEDQNVQAIIDGDIADIDACDVFVANCWQVSWGTAMEVFYAHRNGKTVVLVVPEGHRISPWLRGHSHEIHPTIQAAAASLGPQLGP